jgi:hypothetical protein
MSSELTDIETLLYQVLPDPKGYAERVFRQLRDRLTGQSTLTEQPTVIAGYDDDAFEAIQDRNLLIASALGACECWGEDPGCPNCAGQGKSGWNQPDPSLYGEFVEPASKRISAEGKQKYIHLQSESLLEGEPR